MKPIFIFFLSLPFFLSPTPGHASSLKELFEQGLQAFENRQYDEAINFFQESLKLKPDFAPAYNYLGLVYKEKGEGNEKMIAAFNKAIELNPKYASPYENLGKTYYGMGEIDKAKQYCLKAVKLQPDLVTANLSLGWIYLLGKSEPRNAIRYFKKVVGGNALPYAYLGLGIAYFQDGQYPMVLDMITALRKVDREDLAKHLEQMVRDGHYTPPTVGGIPLLIPERQQSTLVRDEGSALSGMNQKSAQANVGSMPVHLKGKWPDSPETETSQPTLTGAQRIQELQRNSLRQGSGY